MKTCTPLYILQHPYEVVQPKGTAALLAASLQQAELRVGGGFSRDAWINDMLAAPSLRCYLLWPNNEEAISPAELREQMASVSSGATAVTFIMLDGTWRKAYRMLQSNPALARLPRIGLGAIAGQARTLCPLLTLFERTLNTQWQAFAEVRWT